jgi:hypothetical protein
MRRFERELNGMVARADREVARIDTAYLTAGSESEAHAESDGAGTAQGSRQGSEAAESRGAAAARGAMKEGAS